MNSASNDGSGSVNLATVQEVTLPISFEALVIETPGAPVSMQTRSIAALSEDEVLIRTDYASINKMDAGLARANVFGFPEPYVLGFDFSGEVVRVGDDKDATLRVGDQVFGRTPRGGCFAEYAVAKKEHVLPRGVVPAAAASTFGVAYLTAYDAIDHPCGTGT